MIEAMNDEWIAAMHDTDFERAWDISDRFLRERANRKAEKHMGPRHLQVIWQGEPLENARVLVRCYHGLGDTLQFIRFAAPLRAIAREVVVWCQPELLALVRGVKGVDRALPLHNGTVEADFDVDIEVMELPHALRVARPSIGFDVPYLRMSELSEPSEATVGIESHAAGILRVGLVREAGAWDLRRTIPWASFAPLAEVPGVLLYSLQPRSSWGTIPVADISSPSVEMLAVRMAALDVVVTADTMTAHLAGALGLPVWTLLHSACDWRWRLTGRRSLWYPTMTLMRQRTAGDWREPCSEAAKMLQRLSAARRRSRPIDKVPGVRGRT